MRLRTYRISSYKSLPRIIAGPVYIPGGSWPLTLINAGPRIHTGHGSNWLEAWHITPVGYFIFAICLVSASHVKAQVVLRFKAKGNRDG